jgi:hypothetical protein
MQQDICNVAAKDRSTRLLNHYEAPVLRNNRDSWCAKQSRLAPSPDASNDFELHFLFPEQEKFSARPFLSANHIVRH